MTTSDIYSGQDTGDTGAPETTITVTFERYEITLKLGPHREFLDVVGVRVSKDFRSLQQKIESHGYHDVEDLYEA